MGRSGRGGDDAADFAFELDDAPAHTRIEMIGAVLDRVAHPADDDPRLSDAPRAVAAAALIAAQYPGGAPIASAHGPTTPMPEFPAYLRNLLGWSGPTRLQRCASRMPPSWPCGWCPSARTASRRLPTGVKDRTAAVATVGVAAAATRFSNVVRCARRTARGRRERLRCAAPTTA
ncbi:DUF4259 domain-containing protein [Dactylosporangium sp. NPDC050588]|uniref:DUF4259 domain-containing protein n=1 Tax=Dactylosporangium sp. NPDC050588 TaxID=3157211 RepID=UPI0033F5707A